MAKRGRPKGSKNGQHKSPAVSIKAGKRGTPTTTGIKITAGKRTKNA